MSADGYSEPVAEIQRRSRLLAEIAEQAGEDRRDDPVDCVDRIRELLAEYDAGQDARRQDTQCPSWCVECYVSDDGTRNHASYPRAVTGASAKDGDPVMVATWIEYREPGPGLPEAVGIIEKKTIEDAEFTHCDLRALARHLLVIADQVEAIEGAAS